MLWKKIDNLEKKMDYRSEFASISESFTKLYSSLKDDIDKFFRDFEDKKNSTINLINNIKTNTESINKALEVNGVTVGDKLFNIEFPVSSV